MIVLAAGRWLLRPLFHEIAASGAPELFTFAVLFVAIGSAWATHAAGLTFALGAFLAGMMLAETEYRYQVEAGIRPFRDTLLGLFFVTVGMQLDVPELFRHLPVVIALLAGTAAAEDADRDAGGARLRGPVVQGAAHRHRAVRGRRVRLRAADAAAAEPR